MTDPAPKALADEWLSAADCASRTGLTTRALRVYERQGLIAPPRSPNGWRRYGPNELAKLNSIVILKGLGLTLSQIRTVLADNAPSLQRILQAHEESWQTKRDAADHALKLVKAALQRLQTQRSLSIDELCDLIKQVEVHRSVSMNSAAALTRKLINENITPQEERDWMTWWSEHPEDAAAMQAFAKDQAVVMGEAQRLLEQGADPGCPEVQALVAQHSASLRKHQVRERNSRLRAWNHPAARKWMGIGAQQSHLKDNGKLMAFWGKALQQSPQRQALRQIELQFRELIATGIGPSSPLLDAPLARLEHVCREFGLGTPRVYLGWASFVYDVYQPYSKNQEEQGLAQTWEFMLRALEGRAAH